MFNPNSLLHRPHFRFHMPRWFKPSLLALLALLIAGSWLLIVYMLNGQGMLNEIKVNVQSGRAGQMQTVNSVLARPASLGPHVEMLAMYATTEFFQLANRQSKGITYDPTKSLIFLFNENTHMDELPLDATPLQLRVNGGDLITPSTLEMVTYSIHHKMTIATFDKFDGNGQPLYDESAGTFELVAPAMDHSGFAYDNTKEVAVSWELPIIYPEGSLEAQPLQFGTMIALSMGLLATVLTPCLIQLLIFYFSTLTGMGAEQLEKGEALDASTRRRMMTLAFGFVIGYTILFTGAGALAGLAGETLQSTWDNWTRPLAIGSGIVIIILGLWMAIRSRAPLVCKLLLARTKLSKAPNSKTEFWRSSLAGMSFAVGCSTCFGGALIATLLLYVGTLGSVWEGALILFFFSLGVGIPFLLAAALLTRAMPMMRGLQKAAPVIGLVSSMIMIVFGLLLITDNFHIVSAWMTPYLGLS